MKVYSVKLKHIALTASACLILAIMMMLLHGLNEQVYAADESWVSLEVLGEEVYNETTLPAGMVYDSKTRTLTLTNINITVPKDTEFIHANIWDYSDESEPLKIKLVGNNVVNCMGTDTEYPDQLIYSDKIAFEGSGTLTVNNNPAEFVTCVHDVSISGCTLNLGNPTSSPSYIIDIYNSENGSLTLSGCTINITYDAANTMKWAAQNYICGIFNIDSAFIMKNATLNIKTKFTGYSPNYVDGEDYNSGRLDTTTATNGEFRNSTVNITGGFFEDFGDYKQLIIDNTTLKGYGKISVYEKTIFANKHRYGDQDDPDSMIVLEGTYLPKKPELGGGIYMTDGINYFTRDIIPGGKPSASSNTSASDTSKKVTAGTKVGIAAGTIKVTSVKNKTADFTKAKNVRSITVPDVVKINGNSYKITQISENAFTGNKIRTVTIGKNIKKIKKNAFKGSKATKIILKTKKLTKKASVKGALKGSKIKIIKVKIGSKKVNKTYVKKYKKIFTKKNAGKKATVK